MGELQKRIDNAFDYAERHPMSVDEFKAYLWKKVVEEMRKDFKIYMQDDFEGDEMDYISYIEEVIEKWLK